MNTKIFLFSGRDLFEINNWCVGVATLAGSAARHMRRSGNSALPATNVRSGRGHFTLSSRWMPNFSMRLRSVARVMPSIFAACT